MFVNIVRYPPVKPGKDAEFRKWFVESNEAYAKHPGFLHRVLQRKEGGNYAAVVEHETSESFMAMHKSDTQRPSGRRSPRCLRASPSPSSSR